MSAQEQLQELQTTVARLEAVFAKTSGAATVSLAGARRLQRRAMWLGAVGLFALPVVGWAAVELTTFQKGDTISSSDVNDNFASLAAAISARENIQFSASGSFSCATSTFCASDDHVVAITTDGTRAVRVELVAAGVDPGYLSLDLAPSGQTDVQGEIAIQRRTDAGDWEDVYVTVLRYIYSDAGAATMQVPLGVVSFIDRSAPAGEHTYRLLTRVPIATSATIIVTNARLAAGDAGALPT